MNLRTKLAFTLISVVVGGGFAAKSFLNTEPRLTIKVDDSTFSEMIMTPGFGPLQRHPMHDRTLTVPIAYGKQLLQLRRDDGSSLWLFYAHSDVGLRRIVEIRINSKDGETGKATLRYNGFQNNAVTFKFQDHESAEHPLNLHGP
jgi:hypothetical protein